MALAKDTTLRAGITTVPKPGFARDISGKYHPGGNGNNIYQLLRVLIDGRPHLVGSVSKSEGFITDFTTGEVLYNFADFGGAPYLGSDSYCCATEWTNPADGITRYYFGGWFKSPVQVPASGQQNHTNKYGYVVETADFKTWNVIVKDKAQAYDSWQAEVSDLVATNDALYIFRGDTQAGGAGTLTAATAAGATSATATMTFPQLPYPAGTTVYLDYGTANAETAVVASVSGSASPYTITFASPLTKAHASGAAITDAPGDLNQGIWKYTGGAVPGTVPTLSRVTNYWTIKGLVYQDRLVATQWGTPNILQYDPANSDAAGTAYSYNAKVVFGTASSGWNENGAYRAGYGILGGHLVHGTANGYYLGNVLNAGNVGFVPLAITPDDGGTFARATGWRSVFRQVAGGLVFAANAELGGIADALSFLYWLGPGGTIRVLDVGGSYGGIEVYDDRLYFGVSNSHHAGPITNYKLDSPMLGSLPLETLKTANPPGFTENIKYNSYTSVAGVIGWLGGYPTLGYRKASLVINAGAAGNLTVQTISPGRASMSGADATASYTTIAIAATTPTVVDLTPYLDGGILLFKYSVSTSIKGRISFQ